MKSSDNEGREGGDIGKNSRKNQVNCLAINKSMLINKIIN